MTTDPHPTARALREMAARKGVAPLTSPAKPMKASRAPSVRPWGVFRSKWELAYSQHLDVLKAAKRIAWWAYEPDRLPIGIGAHYTPDFLVCLPDGSTQYHEVKGFKREAAMVRLRVAADRHRRATFMLITKKRGHWHATTLTPMPE